MAAVVYVENWIASNTKTIAYTRGEHKFHFQCLEDGNRGNDSSANHSIWSYDVKEWGGAVTMYNVTHCEVWRQTKLQILMQLRLLT